jgi:hypothetical protein
VRVAFTGTGANVNVHVLDTDVPAILVDSATLSHGGSVSVSYVVDPEVGEFFFRGLLGAATLESGQPVSDDVLNDAREPAVHKIIDGHIHSDFEPLLRQAIKQNKDAVPGLDLAKALGI